MRRQGVLPLTRLVSRSQVTASGCWEWTGPLDRHGYGRVALDGVTQLAHRVSWFILRGDIPDATPCLDHLCRNRRCFNPDHLEPVTNAENQRRGALARDDECRNGHPRTEANTYRTQVGSRGCRICMRASVARYKARKTAVA